MTSNPMRMWLPLCALTFALAGCSTMAFSASLYAEQSYRPLTADNKAFRVGDVLTVQVFENSSASTSADTGTRRKNDLNAELSHNSQRVGGIARGVSGGASVGIGGDFDGGGRTQRTNRVLATLTVTILEVLPSGEFKIAGEQQLTVNEEQQKVTLEGRVRPQDISDSNVVLSTRIADARITYLGQGDLTDRQRRSWWRKLLDGVGF